jgi:PPOX class probable F420-dependent enzyme
MPDGSPQITPLWVDHDGTNVIVNTAQGRQKILNMQRDPRVALCIINQENTQNYVQIRGKVIEIIEGEAAWEHFKTMIVKYRPGMDVTQRPPDLSRVLIRIQPLHVQIYG